MNGASKIRIGAGATLKDVTFQVAGKSSVLVEDGVCMEGLDICVWKGSELVFGKGGQFQEIGFSIEKGMVHLAENNCFDSGASTVCPIVSIKDGSLEIGDHNHIKCSFWIRFGGKVKIGSYNCINENTEVRSDESVSIGSYNLVSYNCDIWDTNTHSFYTLEEKEAMFKKDFPNIGIERRRPKTAPVIIGDGNWIGKYACILKGVTMKDNVTVGTRAIVSNETVEEGSVVVSPKGNVL